MDVFMARQAIYDISKQVYAYELMYRQDKNKVWPESFEEGPASENPVPDMINSFGIENITGGNQAFIQLDKDLVLQDFARKFDRDAVIIEVPGTMLNDPEAVRKMAALSTRGYTIALSGQVIDGAIDTAMKYADIIKVDFSKAGEEEISFLSETFAKKKEMLAVKIHTEADFARAVEYGFGYFQGAYFTKNRVNQGKNLSLTATSYSELIAEMGKLSPNFLSLSEMVRSNATLTFKLLQHANTMKFIQKERVTSIHMAMVNMGINEVRRWLLLMLAQEFGNKKQVELIKTSFIRAIFLEKLAMNSSLEERINEVFLMGVLSMLDAISGMDIVDLMKEIPIAEDVKAALVGAEKNAFSELLDFVRAYEEGYWDQIEDCIGQYNCEKSNISKLYLECVINAELVFNNKRMATQ